MNKLLLPTLALALAACAPRTTTATQPVEAHGLPPVTTGEQTVVVAYEASPTQVFEDVLLAIRTDPGVPRYRPPLSIEGDIGEREASGPWTVVSNAPERTITAQARSPRASGGEPDEHRLSVLMTGTEAPLRTEVVFRFTGRAGALVEGISGRLGATYNRLPVR